MPDVRDGRREFGCSVEQWYSGHARAPYTGIIPKLARAIGATIPALSDIAECAPVRARVDWGRWCADCPCSAASMVWLEGPHIVWCATCGNADIDGKFRPVVIPENADMIAAELQSLPVNVQNWKP